MAPVAKGDGAGVRPSKAPDPRPCRVLMGASGDRHTMDEWCASSYGSRAEFHDGDAVCARRAPSGTVGGVLCQSTCTIKIDRRPQGIRSERLASRRTHRPSGSRPREDAPRPTHPALPPAPGAFGFPVLGAPCVRGHRTRCAPRGLRDGLRADRRRAARGRDAGSDACRGVDERRCRLRRARGRIRRRRRRHGHGGPGVGIRRLGPCGRVPLHLPGAPWRRLADRPRR